MHLTLTSSSIIVSLSYFFLVFFASISNIFLAACLTFHCFWWWQMFPLKIYSINSLYKCMCIMYMYLHDAGLGGKMVVFQIILILRNSSINFHSNSNRDRKTRQPSIFALPPISILFYSRYKTIKCVILIFQCHFYIVCSTENDILIKLAPSFEPDHLLQKKLSSNIP